MSDEIDYTDDWMNPQSRSYVWNAPKKEKNFLILREKRLICFGNPGSITQWEVWSEHETKEERDKELAELRQRHPIWRLKADKREPLFARFGI